MTFWPTTMSTGACWNLVEEFIRVVDVVLGFSVLLWIFFLCVTGSVSRGSLDLSWFSLVPLLCQQWFFGLILVFSCATAVSAVVLLISTSVFVFSYLDLVLSCATAVSAVVFMALVLLMG